MADDDIQITVLEEPPLHLTVQEETTLLITVDGGPQGPGGPPGEPGPPGPQGPAGVGAVSQYTHVQAVPAATWAIAHGLGYQPGGVTVLDSGGTHVEGDISYPTLSTVQIVFSGAFSGVAYLS